MLVSKQITLKPLLESFDGIHLTAYLQNRGRLSDLKNQLTEVVNHAYEHLAPVMSSEERSKFFEPVDALIRDASILKKMNGNIGIFRNLDIFRVLNIPVDIDQSIHVATSFHVKPLLRWMQEDQDFLVLGLEESSAHVYVAGKNSLRHLDSVFYSSPSEGMVWINDCIAEHTKLSKPKLFLAGEQKQVDAIKKRIRYKNLIKTPASTDFKQSMIGDISRDLRQLLKAESRRQIEKALTEFHFAEESNRARKNIFQISRAVVQGKVRKLIVSDEISIFGKIDKKSGGLEIHPFDLDHEDDDILDDLAQMVLSQGGEVIIASNHEIPKGRPVLAILEDEDGQEFEFDKLDQHIQQELR